MTGAAGQTPPGARPNRGGRRPVTAQAGIGDAGAFSPCSPGWSREARSNACPRGMVVSRPKREQNPAYRPSGSLLSTGVVHRTALPPVPSAGPGRTAHKSVQATNHPQCYPECGKHCRARTKQEFFENEWLIEHRKSRRRDRFDKEFRCSRKTGPGFDSVKHCPPFPLHARICP